LYEAPGLARFELPEELAAAYGGPLGFSEPRLCANFASSLDGVVASSGELRSSRASESERFVMGLLRACADAVLVGAGTLHASPSTLWTAEHAYPPAARLYAELRRRRGRPPQPTLAVLSGSGSIDPRHPGLVGRTLVRKSEHGAARLGRRLPRSAAVVPCGGEPALDPVMAVEALRAGGHELILCEGGPTVFGALAAAGLVEELFLTLSPLLAGRAGTERRLSLLDGADLLPGRGDCELLTLRRAGSQLFMRYELPAAKATRDALGVKS
jgi:riboflavin biosynthesis pyrimidine reductase